MIKWGKVARQKKGEAGWFGLLALLYFRKKMRKYVINTGCLKRFVKQTQVIWGDKGYFQRFMKEENTNGDFLYKWKLSSQKWNYALLLVRKREGRELFLPLLFLNCLKLKIVLMHKWLLLEWHFLTPFTCKDE